MKLIPYHNRVIIKRIDLEVKTASGIILGEIERDRDTGFGKVIAVGVGRAGEDIISQVGDIVAFNERIPIRVTIKGEHFYQLRESDIFFKIEDENGELEEKPYVKEGAIDNNPRMLG